LRRPPKHRWTDDEAQDRFERFGKMRKREKKASRASDLSERFELPESEWQGKFEGLGFAARIVEVHKRYAFVSPEPELRDIKTRDVRLATIARKFLTARREERNFVCVGDRVLCTHAEPGKEVSSTSELPQVVIQHLAPRQSRLSRRDPSTPGREHILASGMDQVVVVASYRNPTVRWGLIDRYVILCEGEEITPIILLNKRDLLESDEDQAFVKDCHEREAEYQRLGYEVFSIQANVSRKSKRLKDLAQRLDGLVTAFSGHSGVGKSSVINQFDPELVQAVEEDEDIFYKGRHTTTFASFLKLGTGGYVIDTPGIRSFMIQDYDPITLSHCFREMRPLIGKCKYRECRHINEPDCAVQAAVESGEIKPWRYRSYVGILLGETGREGRTREMEVADDEESIE
jgi:ribosome biogenesis GTPase / thiamine phosphate phosphatase